MKRQLICEECGPVEQAWLDGGQVDERLQGVRFGIKSHAIWWEDKLTHPKATVAHLRLKDIRDLADSGVAALTCPTCNLASSVTWEPSRCQTTQRKGQDKANDYDNRSVKPGTAA